MVVDPHYKVSACSGYEENSNDGQGELLARLEAIAAKSGAALAICHHFAKEAPATRTPLTAPPVAECSPRWPDAFSR